MIKEPKPKGRPPIRSQRMSTEESLGNAQNCQKSLQYNKLARPIEERRRYFTISTDNEQVDITNSVYTKYCLESDSENSTSADSFEIPLQQKHFGRKSEPEECNSNLDIERKKHFFTVFVIVLAVFIYALYTNSMFVRVQEDKRVRLNELNVILQESMKTVEAKFCNQKPEIWNDIFSGMYNIILYPEKPFIITLFSSDTKTVNCLAEVLGEISSTVLGTDGYLTLLPEDFANDVGEVIYTLKPKIIQKRAIIVQDLLKINAGAIKAFHNFCDRECPLVDNTIYILTAVIDKYNPVKREIEFMEEEILRVFSSDIETDILNPLTARILDGVVIHVQACPNIDSCTLKTYG